MLPGAFHQQFLGHRRHTTGRLQQPAHSFIGHAGPGGSAGHGSDTGLVQVAQIDTRERGNGSGIAPELAQRGVAHTTRPDRGDDLQRWLMGLTSDAIDQFRGAGVGRVEVVQQQQGRSARRHRSEFLERELLFAGRAQHDLPAFENPLRLEPTQETRLSKPGCTGDPDHARARGRGQRGPQPPQLFLALVGSARHQPRGAGRRRLRGIVGAAGFVETRQRLTCRPRAHAGIRRQ